MDWAFFDSPLFHMFPLGLHLNRMDGSLLKANQAYANIIGRTIEETLGLSYWHITPERYRRLEDYQLEKLRSLGRYGPYAKD